MITSAITYRWIEGDELVILDSLLERRGWKPLNKDLSRAFCAFADDKIVGFMVCQMVLHAGPLLIDPEFRGGEIAPTLAEEMVAYAHDLDAADLLVVPENPFSEALCNAFKLEPVTSPVYLMKR